MRRVVGANKSWIWGDILVPYIITRLALLVAGWFSQYFPRNLGYPLTYAVERGWQFTPHRLLDIWGRWDTGWYMSIITNGYTLQGNIRTTQSNFAFFPLYPYLVKFVLWFVPHHLRTTESTLLVGILVSNLLLLGALIFLYLLVKQNIGDTPTAQRAVLYILLFPTSFFLSSFYSESTFLFFSLGAFYAASKQNWIIAGICGFLLALSRPLGVLILLPLVWMYYEACNWTIAKVRWDIGWLSLIPLGLLTFLFGAYTLTGDFWVPFYIQASWGKAFAMPWVTLTQLPKLEPFISKIDLWLSVGFILLSILAFLQIPSKSYSLYSFLLILPFLFTGTLISASRYLIVAFPVFIVLALLGKYKAVHQFVALAFFAVQILFMVAWSQFYWVA